jgi:hypothetical protein
VTACLSRFGASQIADWLPAFPWVRGVHLKFWDVDDDAGRITGPIRELAASLERLGYVGDYTSEWGGHQWMSLPTGWYDMTVAHRKLWETAVEGAAA